MTCRGRSVAGGGDYTHRRRARGQRRCRCSGRPCADRATSSPSRVRAMIAGVQERERREMVAVDPDADGRNRFAGSGARSGHCCCRLDIARFRPRRRSCHHGFAGRRWWWRPWTRTELEWPRSCRGRQVRCVVALPSREHRGEGLSSMDGRAHCSMRSARPATTPACGPPNSLSPLKVTSAAPSCSVWRAAGSSCSHAGRRPSSATGSLESMRPLPMSATTGKPSVGELSDGGGLDEALDCDSCSGAPSRSAATSCVLAADGLARSRRVECDWWCRRRRDARLTAR